MSRTLILFILFIFALQPLQSQRLDTIPYLDRTLSLPDTCLNSSDIIRSALEIKTLREQNSTLKKLNDELESQISKLESLNRQNESIIALQNKEIKIHSDLTKNFRKDYIDKTPWWKSTEFHFISGAIIGGLSIYLGASAASGR